MRCRGGISPAAACAAGAASVGGGVRCRGGISPAAVARNSHRRVKVGDGYHTPEICPLRSDKRHRPASAADRADRELFSTYTVPRRLETVPRWRGWGQSPTWRDPQLRPSSGPALARLPVSSSGRRYRPTTVDRWRGVDRWLAALSVQFRVPG